MKFEQAFDKAFEIEAARSKKEGGRFAIEPKTAKILAFFWNMMAIAENKQEDFAYIDKNNNIVSVPVDGVVTLSEDAEVVKFGDTAEVNDDNKDVSEEDLTPEEIAEIDAELNAEENGQTSPTETADAETVEGDNGSRDKTA